MFRLAAFDMSLLVWFIKEPLHARTEEKHAKAAIISATCLLLLSSLFPLRKPRVFAVSNERIYARFRLIGPSALVRLGDTRTPKKGYGTVIKNDKRLLTTRKKQTPGSNPDFGPACARTVLRGYGQNVWICVLEKILQKNKMLSTGRKKKELRENNIFRYYRRHVHRRTSSLME